MGYCFNPQQLRGKGTYASNLYSLGVTCLHLLTQLSPFDLYDVGEDAWIWRDQSRLGGYDHSLQCWDLQRDDKDG